MTSMVIFYVFIPVIQIFSIDEKVALYKHPGLAEIPALDGGTGSDIIN